MSEPTLDSNEGFDLLSAWTAAKEQAEADVAELNGKYPPDVVRQLLEAITCKYFWEARKMSAPTSKRFPCV